MISVPENELTAFSSRVDGRIVVITGGGSGIGKETALLFAKFGAKVVIGDVNLEAARAVASMITSSGGTGTALKCDVTVWENQVELFDHAKKTYGSVDVVIANAGVAEYGILPLQQADGTLAPPNLHTIQVNLIGVLYTCSLALHHLGFGGEGDLKALVLIGSTTAIEPLKGTVQYSTAKHGVLGLQRSIGAICTAKGIRSGSVNPWFVDTPLVTDYMPLLEGVRLAPIHRVAATCLAVATNPDPETSERPWVIMPNGSVNRLHDIGIRDEDMELVNSRLKALAEATHGIRPAATA